MLKAHGVFDALDDFLAVAIFYMFQMNSNFTDRLKNKEILKKYLWRR